MIHKKKMIFKDFELNEQEKQNNIAKKEVDVIYL